MTLPSSGFKFEYSISPGISMRGSLMFIQKLRENGRLSLSSTQTTPTFSIAAMRAFSSAGSAGMRGTT